jgi:hypothetical protein
MHSAIPDFMQQLTIFDFESKCNCDIRASVRAMIPDLKGLDPVCYWCRKV